MNTGKYEVIFPQGHCQSRGAVIPIIDGGGPGDDNHTEIQTFSTVPV